jgi:AraC family transcriptional activator FtrA
MDPKLGDVRTVVCVAYDDLSLFEAGIASEVFGLERPEFAHALYRFRVAQAEPGVLRSRGGLQLRADGGLRLLNGADLVIVPGWRGAEAPDALLRALRRAHERGAQLLSICTGAFVLAEAGLLDGLAATTHWRYVAAFRQRFPKVDWRADVLYVDADSILTSAGSAAGIDACLHVVRRHHGSAVANLVARTMVTPPHRQAGQAQFIPMPVGPATRSGLGPVLDWARARLDGPLRVADMAGRAAMSERNFLRRFSAQVGIGPKEWLRRERVAAAQALLERSSQRLDAVAQAVGFGSASALRAAFRETVGVPPTLHRRQFGSPGPAPN